MEVNEITVDSYSWHFKSIFTSNEKILKAIAKDLQKHIARLKAMVESALQPFMKMGSLKRSLTSYKKIALDLEKALAPSRDFFNSLPISEMANKEARAARTDGADEVKYIGVMTMAGWPPLFDVPIELIRGINRQYQEAGRDAFRSYAAKEITGFYDKSKIHAIGERWSQKKKLALRFPFLNEALSAHNNGKYALTVPMLTAKIQGLLLKINGRAGRLQPEQFNLYIDSLFSRKNDCRPLRGLIVDGMYKNFSWSDKVLPCLSRFTLLHGADADGSAREVSLKLILILDMLVRLL